MALTLRRKLFALTIVLASGAASGPSYADDEQLKSFVQQFLSQGRCERGAAAVGLIDHDSGSTFSVGSVTAHNGSPREVRDTDEFALGSITKTFVAALYAMALQEGKVRPNTPAQELMPAGVVLPVYKSHAGKAAQITLDNLVRHSSGLPRIAGMGNEQRTSFTTGGVSREKLIEDLKNSELQFAPGSHYLYSNAGFAVLAMALEQVYGKDIGALVAEKITGPLGMSNTVFDFSALSGDSIIDGFRPDGEPAQEHEPTYPAYEGAIGLRSTSDDMMKYLRYNMRLTSVPGLSDLLGSMQKTQTLHATGEKESRKVGFAWESAELPDGRKLIWKDGNVPGFRSFIGFTAPPHAVGAFVLTTQNGCRATKVGRCLIEMVSHTRPDGYCSGEGPARRGPMPQGRSESEE